MQQLYHSWQQVILSVYVSVEVCTMYIFYKVDESKGTQLSPRYGALTLYFGQKAKALYTSAFSGKI